MPKLIKKSMSTHQANKYIALCLLLFPIVSNAAVIEIPFLDDIWDTFTKVVLPILIAVGLLGAFIADRQDSETAKRILLNVAVIAVALKVVIAFISWVRSLLAGI